MNEKYSEAFIWEGVGIGKGDPKRLEQQMTNVFKARVKVAEEVIAENPETGEKMSNMFFYVADDDISKFVKKNVNPYMRWWGGFLRTLHGLYLPEDTHEKFDGPWEAYELYKACRDPKTRERVEAYCKAQGLEVSDSMTDSFFGPASTTLEVLLYAIDPENGVDSADYDRWLMLNHLIGTQLTFEAAMEITQFFWEEEAEVFDFNIMDFESTQARDILNLSEKEILEQLIGCSLDEKESDKYISYFKDYGYDIHSFRLAPEGEK